MTADQPSPTLVEFLLARLGEDEAAARAATPGPWRWDETPVDGWGHQPPDLVTVATERRSTARSDGSVIEWDSPVGIVISSWGHDADGVSVSSGDMAHIARHDPASVLADVEAKRRILDLHHPYDHRGEHGDATFCSECQWDHVNDEPRIDNQPVEGFGTHPCLTLLALALPYVDHADYDERWRP